MPDPVDLAALRRGLGDDAVTEHAPFRCDGLDVAVTVRPADGAALSSALALLAERGLAALVRGGGNRMGVGNPPTRADVVLATERLRGVAVFEPAEGVCQVRAGTPVAELAAVVAEAGWEVPLDPPGADATVGGALAAAACGPRAHGQGLPRDAVLGLDVALAGGQRTRCGGRVVKNVTGYDIAKLYTGSFGSLGVIEAAWLRLRPRPREVQCLTADLASAPDAYALALDAARRPSARATCLRGGGADGPQLIAEFAGEEPAVARDAAWLAGACGAAPAPAGCVDGLRDRQGGLAAAGLRFRIAALASRTAALAAALAAAGAEFLWYPGLQLVYAGFALPAERDAAAACQRVFSAVESAAASAGGTVLCEAAPLHAKRGREMHGDVAALLPLFRNLKQRFDPGGLLNPGRFAGSL